MDIKILIIMTGGMRREGITTTQLEICKKIDKSGLDISFAAVHNNSQEVIDEFTHLGCKVLIMPDRRKHPFRYMQKLYAVMKKEKYDIVHVHGSSALISMELMTAKAAGVKVRIAHSRNTRCNNVKADKLLRPVFYRSYTHAMACGQEAGKWLFRDRDFTVFYNGKDFSRFKFQPGIRDKIREEYGIGNKLAVGHVGNMNSVKNQSFLLDVFDELHRSRPESVLYLIGDGAYRGMIEEKVKSLGLSESVVLTGRVSNVHELLQGMDIMALPSLYEGLPNVVLEWQIAGLPSLIADNITRECKLTDLVSYLPIDSTEPWVNALSGFEPSGDREEVSGQACEAMKAAGFDIEESVKNIRKFYIEAAEGLQE